MEKLSSPVEDKRNFRSLPRMRFRPMAVAACCILLATFVGRGEEAGNLFRNKPEENPKKHIAFSADTEAYFMPRDFEHFQGEFTRQIMEVCREWHIPFTWLVIVNSAHTEVKTIGREIFPLRRDMDEFSLHVHFKWFIMDSDDDFKSFKIVDRRMKWLRDAKAAIEQYGLPMPRSFRYGGGDSKDRYYCIEDLIYLHDELGIRNYLFNPDRIPGVIGIQRYERKGNGIWFIDGDREITLLSTCVYLDEEINSIRDALDRRLNSADYAIIGSHDYREAVPDNLRKTIQYLNAGYDVEYVTIDKIGEMVRRGEIRNESWIE